MAKVPLRAYNSEIEKLIESGQIPEAVAHCKHILKLYPKHIDTYRLLGKAFLESQRYSEAADILQRVLSVIPDDFISQIGMSIIREDERNLDAAIFHMERAFEVQPANAAIQNELRRLHGRRDGVEPPKIRLTRGALVRMYMRGELYPQAVAEARAALAEDPQRHDIQVLLARLYYLAGQKVQAAEAASKLVAKLPYCYEANRILADVLPGTSRAEDAKLYQERIQALDPYSAFISEKSPTSAEVPDNAVQIDRLEYQPAQEETAQPEWTRTVGVSWDGEPESPAAPDWLTGETDESMKALQGAEAPQAPPAEPQPEEPAAQPAEIPDWMAAAGWSSSSGAVEETPVNFEETEAAAAAASAEIPDWLQQLAPAEGAPLPEQQAEQVEEDGEWFQKIIGGELPAAEPSPDTAPAVPVELADQAETTAAEAGQPQPEELPDWMAGETAAPSVAEQPETEFPAWMADLGIQPPESQAEQAVESVSEISPVAAEELQPAMSETPDWFADLGAAPQETPQPESELPERQPVVGIEPEETMVFASDEAVQPSEVSGETPEQEEARQPLAEAAGQPVETGEAIALPPMAEPAEISAAEPPAETPVAEAGMGEDLDSALAWLEALAAKQGAEEGTLQAAADERPEEMPEWLKKEVQEGEVLPAAEAAMEESETRAEPVEAAAEQPAEAEAADLPEWLQSLQPEASLETGAEETSVSANEGAAESVEEPEWLRLMGQPAETTPEEPPVEEEQPQPAAETVVELPAWLSEETAPAEEAVSEPEPSGFQTPAEEEQPVTPEPSTEPETELPSWLSEEPAPTVEMPIQSELQVAAAETTTTPELAGMPEDIDAALAWLEGLAAKQGAEEGTLATPASERQEVAPEWLRAEQTAEAALQETTTAEAEHAAVETPVAETVIPEPQQAEMEAPIAENEVSPLEERQQEILIEEVVEEPVIEEAPPVAPSVEGWQAEEAVIAETPSEGSMPESTQPEEEAVEEKTQPVMTIPQERTPAPEEQAEPVREEPRPEQEIVSEWLPEAEGEETSTLPEWLQDLGSYSATTAVPTVQGQKPREPLPQWLQEMEAESAADVEAQPVQEPVKTEWVPEIDQAAPPVSLEETAVETAPAGQPVEELAEEAAAVPSEQEPTAEQPETMIQEAAPASGELSGYEDVLAAGQKALEQGDVDAALEHYDQLAQAGEHLEETIHDLRDALYRYPVNVNIWQTLGDAYLRSNRVQDALDAYTKAEELLR